MSKDSTKAPDTIVLDHGVGAVGMAVNSAPTEGVKVVPMSQIRAAFPVLENPANRHKAVGFTHEQWQVKEFPGPHLLPSRDGWEEVADYALEWALSHATGAGGRNPA